VSRGIGTVRQLARRFELRDRLVALGLVRYKPKTWTNERWEADYGDGTLDYFGDLSERSRFSILVGYLDFLGPQHRVLDAGCGNGFLFERARHLQFDEWVGADLSTAAVDSAIERAAGDPRARFIAEDLLAADTTWTDHRYSCVIFMDVLYMSDNPERLIDLAVDALEPGGKVLVSSWCHIGENRLWHMLEARLKIVDAVQIIPQNSDKAEKGWRLALLEPISGSRGPREWLKSPSTR